MRRHAEQFFDASLQPTTQATDNAVSAIFLRSKCPLQILTGYRSGQVAEGIIFAARIKAARDLVHAGFARYLELKETVDDSELLAPLGFRSRMTEMIRLTDGMPFSTSNQSLIAVKVSAVQVRQHEPSNGEASRASL